MGKRDRREVVSRLTVILLHLLKDKYQPERRAKSWSTTIAREREELSLVLDDSPSLKAEVPSLIKGAYKRALTDAASETGLDITTFPDVCEWTMCEVLAS